MRIGVFSIIIFMITSAVIVKPKKLLEAVVFFAPFCASSVISFPFFFLQPGHYFLFLYILISLIYSFEKNGGRINTQLKGSNKWLLAFLLLALFSIVLAIIFRIDEPVYGIGNNNQIKSSLVSLQNFTQYLYLFLGYILYRIIFKYCYSNRKRWNQLLHVFCVSGMVVLCIGIYQVIAGRFHLPYDEIFRNSVKEMWQTKERVQATFGEASFFGQYCVYLFTVYSTCLWTKKKILKLITVFFSIIMGVMSRSSTFLFGIISVVIFYVFLKKADRITMLKYIFLSIIGPLALYYAVNNVAYVQRLLVSASSKLQLESWSGIERLTIFKHMLNVGIKYPLFGIGYGGGRSTDLYANIFSNVGILGVMTFFGFIVKDLMILFQNKDKPECLMCILLIIGFLMTSCSIPDLSYLPVWVIFGLVDSRCYQLKHKTILINGGV